MHYTSHTTHTESTPPPGMYLNKVTEWLGFTTEDHHALRNLYLHHCSCVLLYPQEPHYLDGISRQFNRRLIPKDLSHSTACSSEWAVFFFECVCFYFFFFYRVFICLYCVVCIVLSCVYFFLSYCVCIVSYRIVSIEYRVLSVCGVGSTLYGIIHRVSHSH